MNRNEWLRQNRRRHAIIDERLRKFAAGLVTKEEMLRWLGGQRKPRDWAAETTGSAGSAGDNDADGARQETRPRDGQGKKEEEEMSAVTHHQVRLRGHTRDLRAFPEGRGERTMGGIVGEAWAVSVPADDGVSRTAEFFSRRIPLHKDVALLSRRHPKVLVEWSYYVAENAAEGIVVAGGGEVHAAGWWEEPHHDGDTCGEG